VRKRNEEGILVEAGLCLETEYTEFCSIQLNVIVTSAETNTLKVLKTEQFYFIPQEKKKKRSYFSKVPFIWLNIFKFYSKSEVISWCPDLIKSVKNNCSM
jgi:hypothetical protein